MVSLGIFALFSVAMSFSFLQFNRAAVGARDLTGVQNLLWSQVTQAQVLSYSIGNGTAVKPDQISEILKTATDAKATATTSPATFTYTSANMATYTPSFEALSGNVYRVPDTTVPPNPLNNGSVWYVSGLPVDVTANPTRTDLSTSQQTPAVAGTLFRETTLLNTGVVINNDKTTATDLGVRVVRVAVTYTERGQNRTVLMTTFRASN